MNFARRIEWTQYERKYEAEQSCVLQLSAIFRMAVALSFLYMPKAQFILETQTIEFFFFLYHDEVPSNIIILLSGIKDSKFVSGSSKCI